MTKNYPEWQEPLRKALEARKLTIEENDQKNQEKENAKLESESNALGDLLISLGLPAGVPIIEEGKTARRRIGDYDFYIFTNRNSHHELTVSPALNEETIELFNETECWWNDYFHLDYELAGDNSVAYLSRDWDPAKDGLVTGYTLWKTGENAKQNLLCHLAATIEAIDRAVDEALKNAKIRLANLKPNVSAPIIKQLTFGEELAALLDKHINALISNERAEYNNEY